MAAVREREAGREGGGDYPLKTELLRAALWLLVAWVVAYAVRKLVAEVRKLAARHRSVLETANEAFISMDSEGLIVDWNSQAERDFGWHREEVMGVPLEEVIIPRRLRASHRQGLRRFLRSGEGWMVGPRREVQALRRDGREFPVEISISALRSENEQGYVFNAFLHDISARSEGDGRCGTRRSGSAARSTMPASAWRWSGTTGAGSA